MPDHDADYYRQSERAERELADQSRDEAVRRIHLQMAGKYAALADDAGRPARSPNVPSR